MAVLVLSPPCHHPAAIRPGWHPASCSRAAAGLQQLPQFRMEGDYNLWIIRRGAMSCSGGEASGKRGFGHRLPGEEGSHQRRVSPLAGITCLAQLEEVWEVVGKCAVPSVRPGEWVVQKYVEQPLLILGTKFDSQQWFLLTSWNLLTIWLYRDSYMCFCSWPFYLHRLHQ